MKAITAHNAAAAAAQNACSARSEAGQLTGTQFQNCINVNGLRQLPAGIDVTVSKPRPGQLTLTPREVAYQAIATLDLPAPKPGIGLSPDLNPWKMAAVGYPLWLWGDGNLNPGRVTSRVANLSVALEAHVEKMVFTMGDGHSVSCTAEQAAHPWRLHAVEPGTPSPWCGYRYTRPSLPQGRYTISAYAHYRITWEINGQRGSQPYVAPPTSVQLPVGELQVTVR